MYEFHTELKQPFDQALEQVRASLMEEHLGIVSDVDVQAILAKAAAAGEIDAVADDDRPRQPAAGQRGLKVTGLTLSKEQHDYAKKRVHEAGLSERVEIVMRDYRDERVTIMRLELAR